MLNPSCLIAKNCSLLLIILFSKVAVASETGNSLSASEGNQVIEVEQVESTPVKLPFELLTQSPSNSFPLREVRLEGSTVFSPAQIRVVVASYLNKTVTFDDLVAIRKLLTDLYVQAGYTTSAVILLKQEAQNGIVIYQSLEGQLESLEITGLAHLQEQYVRDRLNRYITIPLNIPKLQEGLQMLQQNPLFEKVEAQ